MAVNKIRGKNFSDAENRQLCLSWLAISEDPIKGTDQSCSTFWSTILDHAKLYTPSFESRTPDGLRQRWGVISRSVSKFTGCFKTVMRLNESGTNEEDKVEKAKALYKQDQKEDFRYMECWEILRKAPKFALDSQSMSTPTSTPTQSRNMSPEVSLSRPLGRNNAKANAKSHELEVRRVEALEKIAAASEGKIQFFQEYAAALRQENLIKLATIRIEDLDETSAQLIKLQKEQLLNKLHTDVAGTVSPTPQLYLDDIQAQEQEEWIDEDNDFMSYVNDE